MPALKPPLPNILSFKYFSFKRLAELGSHALRAERNSAHQDIKITLFLRCAGRAPSLEGRDTNPDE
jgi:hypothetical protein